MARKKHSRRKIHRKAPSVRRSQPPGSVLASRRPSDLMVGGMMDPAEKAADWRADRATRGLDAPAFAHGTNIAAWKSGLETLINADTDKQLKANPSEANEELNATTAECTQY